jgi:hypothetical protein
MQGGDDKKATLSKHYSTERWENYMKEVLCEKTEDWAVFRFKTLPGSAEARLFPGTVI